jgi:hypothetical protein
MAMIRFAITFVATLTAGVSTAFAAAQLELSLISPQEQFVLGEPVTVRARLANTGDEPIQVPRNLEPEYGAVVYQIAGPETKQFSPWALKEPAEPFTMLAPGQVIDQEIDLFYGGAGWTFQEPGIYQITASYADIASSAPLPVNIRVPASDAERDAAARLLSSDEAGRFLLFRGGEHLTEGISVLEALAQTAPQTPHAAYANVALGINQLRPARDFAKGTVRQADPQAAATRLNSVQDKALPLGWMIQSQLGLAKALRDTGQDAQASEIENKLPDAALQRFPDIDPNTLRDMVIPDVLRQLQ